MRERQTKSISVHRGLWFRITAGFFLLLLSCWGTAESPFSRSHWIADRMHAVWFSGGVLPQPRVLTRPPIEAAFLTQEMDSQAPRNFRVSRDKFRGPPEGAQPEMQVEPMIAIDPMDPRLLVSGYQDNRFSDGGARVLSYAFSTNGGKKWKERIIPQLTVAKGGPWDRASDPWVAFGPDHRVYYSSIAFNQTDPANGVFVNVSTNGGRTFGPPVQVAVSGVEAFNDKEAVVADNFPDSPFRGNVYVAWDAVQLTNDQVMQVSRSTDGGQSFLPPAILASSGVNIGVVPLVGPGGVVYAIWRQIDAGENRIVISRSKNGGVNWTRPKKIAVVRTASLLDLRTGDVLQMAAVDPISGDIYVVWQDLRFNSIPQIVISRSRNGGKKWTRPKRVSDGTLPSFTPAVAVDADGRVAVSYYSLRTDLGNRFLVDVFSSISDNGGRTFATPQRITRKSFDVRFAAQVVAFSGSAFFLGDYHGIAGDISSFHPLWIGTPRNSRIDSSMKQADAFTAELIQ